MGQSSALSYTILDETSVALKHKFMAVLISVSLEHKGNERDATEGNRLSLQ